jgi:hypothetical protein
MLNRIKSMSVYLKIAWTQDTTVRFLTQGKKPKGSDYSLKDLFKDL